MDPFLIIDRALLLLRFATIYTHFANRTITDQAEILRPYWKFIKEGRSSQKMAKRAKGFVGQYQYYGASILFDFFTWGAKPNLRDGSSLKFR